MSKVEKLLFLFKKLLTVCIPDLGFELSFPPCTLHTAIAGRAAQCQRWRSLGFSLVWLNRWQTTTVMLMSFARSGEVSPVWMIGAFCPWPEIEFSQREI